MNRNFYTGLGLIVFMSGLSGCANNFDNTSLGEEHVQVQEKQFERVDQQERPASLSAQSLDALKPGHKIAYYLNEFTQLGYTITGAREWDDGVVYELHHANGQDAMFYLLMPNQTDIAEKVAVIPTQKQSRQQPASNITFEDLQSEVQNLPRGKTPSAYLPTIQKYGILKSYRVYGEDKAVYDIQTGNNQLYRITMDLNPNNGRVTTMKVTAG